MPSGNEKIRVYAEVTSVKTNGWAIAEVLRTTHSGSGNSARPGQTIAVHAKYGKAVGDQVKCDVVRNDKGSDDWFAINCLASLQRKTDMHWDPWQASKSNPLSRDLPTTVSGTRHDGIKLGCWCCGKLLVDEGHIHRIKDTSVWTNSNFDAANFIFDRERKQLNKYKKCTLVPVRCSGCKQSVATLYEEQFWDSDTNDLITAEKQPVPCLKVTTLRKPKGETSWEHHTVLLGEEGTVRDAIGSLTTHEIDELNKLLPRMGRIGQDEYATRKKLLEARGLETKLDCNVCFAEYSSLEGIRCANNHFMCNECFGGDDAYVSSVCDDALGKGCLKVKCCIPECDFAFEHHDVCHHLGAQAFRKFDEAGKRLREQKALEEEKQRLEDEVKRESRKSEEERKINGAKHKIINDILTLTCPRCKAAFVDFDGCFALKCRSCPCGFCAGCLQDCDSDAHHHVSRCRVCHETDTAMTDRFYGSFEHFERIHRKRRKKLLEEFLKQPDMRELAGKLVQALRANLEDHGLQCIVSKYGGGSQ